MKTEAKPEILSTVTARGIKLGDSSAVVYIEESNASGYLIAERYSIGVLPTEIKLTNAIYLYNSGEASDFMKIPKVLISFKERYWTAVDTSMIAIIPCPSLDPYPVLFISEHGFNWMSEAIEKKDYPRLLKHLSDRFTATKFKTNRQILQESNSPFTNAEIMTL